MTHKIAFIIDEYLGPIAGTEKQIQQLISGLKNSDFEPELIVLRESSYLKNDTALCPVHVLNVPKLMSIGTVLKGFRLARMLRNNSFKLSHIFFPDASIFAPLFCKMAGTKVVVSRRDQGFLYSSKQVRLVKAVDRFVDSIVANSEAVRESLRGNIGSSSYKKTVVIYNGCDHMDSGGKKNISLKNELTIPSNSPVIGMVANFNPWKRHQDALKAFAFVKRSNPRTHLILVGDGYQRRRIEKLALSLKLEQSVHFLGTRQNISDILKECEICILCSQTEGLSNALIEYMMAGKPVVATDVGGNKEVVIDGVTGFLVPPGEIELLAQRISELLHNEKLARKMGAEGRRVAQEKFSTTKMVEKHILLYKKLLEG